MRAPDFKEEYELLPLRTQEEIRRVKEKLKENPYVGDPLGYRFLREKKLQGRRLYFLIYEGLNVVLLITVSDKRMQQETIDEIKERLPLYYTFVRRAL